MPTTTDQSPPVIAGTGYRDAHGNVWIYPPTGRRILAPGEVYISTRGELLTVPCAH